MGQELKHHRPQCPPEAVAHLCEKTNSRVLLYHESLSEKAILSSKVPGISILPLKMVWTPHRGESRSSILTNNSTSGEDIAYIFHTSGTSSGLPKPILQTHHVAVGVLPRLESKDSATFTTTPLYHGGIADCFRAWSSGAMIWLFPGASQPVTTQNILKCISTAKISAKTHHCPPIKYFSSVPYVLEMLSDENDGRAMLKKMAVVGVGGASLSSSVGDSLVSDGINLISRFGSAECGFLLSSHRHFVMDKGWQYLRLPSGTIHLQFEEQNDGSGLSELVVLKGWPHMSKSNREDGSFATSDFFQPHPSIKDSWRYHSRKDSQITLITGKKFDPAPLEDDIRNSSSLIDQTLIVGNGKQNPGLLVFPVENQVDRDRIFDDVLKIVEKLNSHGQEHAHILKHMIAIIPGSRGLKKSSKGTILRGETERAFYDEISQLYGRDIKTDRCGQEAKEEHSNENIHDVVVKIVEQAIGNTPLEEDSDFFHSGVDSTQCSWIRGQLEKVHSIPLISRHANL